MPEAAIVTGSHAHVAHPLGGHARVALRDGLHLAWAPMLLQRRALLVLFAGAEADAGVATTLSREGLRRLIADIQSIDAQLGEML